MSWVACMLNDSSTFVYGDATRWRMTKEGSSSVRSVSVGEVSYVPFVGGTGKGVGMV